MTENLESQFREALEIIQDAYSDFVDGMMVRCDTDERKKKIINFIKGNENVTTSDVIEFYSDEIFPEKKAEREKKNER